ncbi:MAG TPA: hypothetical protein VF688_04600, partial [Allosphingosinicella sp.]
MNLLPVLGLIVGAVGLLFATFLAVRNRTLFRPKLDVAFSTPFQFENPKVESPHPLVAIFIFNPPDQVASDLRLPILVRNVSKRKVSDIVIELTYPAQFAFTNTEIIGRYQRYLELFGDSPDSLEEIKAFLEKRQGNRFGNLYRFRYDMGTLRPGDSLSFEEMLKLPMREKAFRDGRYS